VSLTPISKHLSGHFAPIVDPYHAREAPLYSDLLKRSNRNPPKK